MTQTADNTTARRQPISMVLVDDSRDFLESASDFLARLPGVKVAGKFLDSEAALAAAKSLRPDLMLLDFVFPSGNALAVVRLLKALPDSPLVIVVSLMEGTAYRAAACEAGADGYINKAEFAVALPQMIGTLFSARMGCAV